MSTSVLSLPSLSSFALPERLWLRRVLALAWPIGVSMLSYTGLMLVDGVLLAHHGSSAVAAAGLAMTWSFVALALGSGVARAVKVVAAQRIGARRMVDVHALAAQSLWIAVLFGGPTAALAVLAGPLVHLVAEPELAAIALPSLQIRLLGAPLLLVAAGLGAFLQARGRTRATMIAMVSSYAATVVVELVLLDGCGPVPAIGPVGASWAAVLGWAVQATILLRASSSSLRRGLAPNVALIREVCAIGLPMGLHFVLDVASFAVFAGMLARVSNAELAGHVLAMRVNAVSFLPGFAIGEAGAVLVGQAIGAKRPWEGLAAWRASLALAVGVMAAWAVVFATIPKALLSIFDAGPETLEVAATLLLVAAGFQVLDAIATIAYCTLAAAGDTRFAMVSAVAAAWIVKMPLAAWAVANGHGALGAWLALSLEVAVLAIVGTWRVRRLLGSEVS